MGKHSDPPKAKPAILPKDDNPMSGIVVVRLVIAAVIFAFALLLKLPAVLSTALLVVSAAVAGYDIAIKAVDAVENHEYFATPVVIMFVAVLSFFVGSGLEGAALVMLYKIGLALISYAEDHTKKAARELLQYQDDSIAERAAVLMEAEGAGDTKLSADISSAASYILRFVIIFGVLYAVVMPIFTSLSFSSALRRALTIILVGTPLSVVVSLPLTGLVGLAHSAQHGVLFNNAQTMERVTDVNTVIIDKAGVFSEESPKLLAVKSDVLDNKTFMDFIAHAVYYSEQPFAKAIGAAFDQEYQLDLISDFVEIPGSGVDLKIGGTHVTLGTRELFASRGEAVPYEGAVENPSYYLMVNEKYIGKVELSDNLHEDATGLISGLKEHGIKKCVLFAEEGKDESERLGISLNADEVYAECDTDKKVKLLQNLSAGHESDVLYLYSTGIESHSAAAVDVRVSQKTKFADALLLPKFIGNFPESIQICHRMTQIIAENAIFAMAIKAVLIFLSMIGRCTIWFAIFLDMAAALATLLNTIRVTKAPLIDLSRNQASVSNEQEE